MNDRLFPIKQRSPQHQPQNPIAFPSSPNSDRTLTTHKCDRLSSTSNSDRPSPPQTRSPIYYIKQRSPFSPPTKPDRLNPHINQRSPLHHPQNPIAFSPHQTAITCQHSDEGYTT